jgi:hypothetical protein
MEPASSLHPSGFDPARDQYRRWSHQLKDAEYIRRCREIDRLSGHEWEAMRKFNGEPHD